MEYFASDSFLQNKSLILICCTDLLLILFLTSDSLMHLLLMTAKMISQYIYDWSFHGISKLSYRQDWYDMLENAPCHRIFMTG